MLKYDITGKQFGNWTVLYRDNSYKSSKHSKWICRCTCGTIKSVIKDSLISGRSKSCGCIKTIHYGVNQKHGLSKTRIYHEWTSMRRRCKSTYGKDSKTYYKRGISVCQEWENNFMSFYNWAIKNGYSDELTIDRIDNNLGYSPDNCRWITIEEQQRNKSNTVFITYKGEKWCLRTLCIKLGYPYKSIHGRYLKMLKTNEPITFENLFAPYTHN